MQNKVFIFTATEPDNNFPENFSCWCAGALEAKRCYTELEIIRLENFPGPLPRKCLDIKKEKLRRLKTILVTTKKLVLILPEYNSMLPDGLDSFIEVLLTRKRDITCKLVSIVMDPATNQGGNIQDHTLFNYPLTKLDKLWGSALIENRIQIKNHPNGNMCNLFATFYNELRSLIQQILD